MSAFDNEIKTEIQDVIVNTYDALIVELNTALINSISSLTPTEKTSAIGELVAKSPKMNQQFTKLVELTVKGIIDGVRDQIFKRCYVLVPKSTTGIVNYADINIIEENGAEYQTLKEDADCCYLKGRIFFSADNMAEPIETPCDCSP